MKLNDGEDLHVEQIENGNWLWRAVHIPGEVFLVGIEADEIGANRAARTALASMRRLHSETSG